MSNERAVLTGNDQHAGPTDTDTKYGGGNIYKWIGPVLICATVLIAYLFAPAIPPLLDEQFFLKWTANAGREAAPLTDYLMWRGFDPADQWGPLTAIFNKLSHICTFGVLPLMRIEGMLLHAATATLLFLALRRLFKGAGQGVTIPLAAAVLFAAYPINAEAVAWLGGRGLELAGAFFAGSFYCYLRARGIGRLDNAGAAGLDWKWLTASFSLYTLSLLSSSAVWSCALLFGLLELWLSFTGSRETGAQSPNAASTNATVKLIGPLVFIVIAAAYVAANGSLFQMTSYEIKPDLSGSAIFTTLKALIFPINEAIWHKYAYAYDLLYVLFPPFAGLFIAALVRSPSLRALSGFCAIWWLLAVVPEIGHITKENLYGARLFYLAAMPLSTLLAAILCSASFVIPARLGRTRVIASVPGVLLLTVFFLAHITNQNMAWRNGGRQMAAMQKSLAVIHSHTNAPYLLASGLPSWTTVSPRYATRDIAVFDGETGLLSALAVSSGHLKDALLAGKYKDVAVNWVEDLRSFMPMDLSVLEEPLTTIDARQIASRFVPAIAFFPTAHFDEAQNLLMLSSNNAQGPVMRIAANGLCPVRDDFIYVDASIEAPPSSDKPIVEMYWQTVTKSDYDNKTRRVWTKAFVDGQLHRYYLSLRTPGWIDSGTLRTITFGFPAGAKVVVKSIGTSPRNAVSPAFDAVAEDNGNRKRFDAPFYNFPNAPELGLYTFAQSSPITVTHDAGEEQGAAGVALEISMPDKVFSNANGNEASGVGGKTIGIEGVRGTYRIPTTDFPHSGVYSLRAIAIDDKHDLLGQYSDAVYCLVRKPLKTGWTEQLQ